MSIKRWAVVVLAFAAGTSAVAGALAGLQSVEKRLARRVQPCVPISSIGEYVRLHRLALDPAGPEWPETMRRLAGTGDHFTMHLLSRLDVRELRERGAMRARDRALADIARRLEPETGSSVTATLQLRLERAAQADLNCDRLERLLVPWSLNSVRAHLDDEGVRAKLAELAASFEPAIPEETLFSSPRERVRSYARMLLAEGSAAGRP